MGTMNESPDPELLALGFTQSDLSSVRRLVEDEAAAAGLPPERIADVVFAVNEIATNALRHGAQPASIRVWHQTGRLLCEVRDSGKGLPESVATGLKPKIGPGRRLGPLGRPPALRGDRVPRRQLGDGGQGARLLARHRLSSQPRLS